MTVRLKKIIFLLVLGAITIGLQTTFWFGKNSYATLSQIENQIQLESQHNLSLEYRNDLLKAEVLDLQTGDDTMEERARMELGLVKEDEIFYRIITVNSENPSG